MSARAPLTIVIPSHEERGTISRRPQHRARHPLPATFQVIPAREGGAAGGPAGGREGGGLATSTTDVQEVGRKVAQQRCRQRLPWVQAAAAAAKIKTSSPHQVELTSHSSGSSGRHPHRTATAFPQGPHPINLPVSSNTVIRAAPTTPVSPDHAPHNPIRVAAPPPPPYTVIRDALLSPVSPNRHDSRDCRDERNRRRGRLRSRRSPEPPSRSRSCYWRSPRGSSGTPLPSGGAGGASTAGGTRQYAPGRPPPGLYCLQHRPDVLALVLVLGAQDRGYSWVAGVIRSVTRWTSRCTGIVFSQNVAFLRMPKPLCL